MELTRETRLAAYPLSSSQSQPVVTTSLKRKEGTVKVELQSSSQMGEQQSISELEKLHEGMIKM